MSSIGKNARQPYVAQKDIATTIDIEPRAIGGDKFFTTAS
jgi:predicted transcriptional regulator